MNARLPRFFVSSTNTIPQSMTQKTTITPKSRYVAHVQMIWVDPKVRDTKSRLDFWPIWLLAECFWPMDFWLVPKGRYVKKGRFIFYLPYTFYRMYVTQRAVKMLHNLTLLTLQMKFWIQYLWMNWQKCNILAKKTSGE